MAIKTEPELNSNSYKLFANAIFKKLVKGCVFAVYNFRPNMTEYLQKNIVPLNSLEGKFED